MLNVRVLGAVALLASTGNAFAQQQPDPGRLTAALEVVHAMGGPTSVAQTFAAMRPGMIKLIEANGKTPPDRAASLYDNVMLPALQAHVGDLLESKAHILAEHFTVTELTDIRNFYASATGKKLLANQGAIAVETMQDMQPLMRDIIARTTAYQNATHDAPGSKP